jgi:hypothetical protein
MIDRLRESVVVAASWRRVCRRSPPHAAVHSGAAANERVVIPAIIAKEARGNALIDGGTGDTVTGSGGGVSTGAGAGLPGGSRWVQQQLAAEAEYGRFLATSGTDSGAHRNLSTANCGFVR